ncbi:MAG: 3-phosphoserine/phosphohydroxythreonine transaminase [Deltaproteobacteria bacterium]|nr:3-phosphoserine/phosphohydroxythreonine transaminase [Deltaproteobacteria bacterium]
MNKANRVMNFSGGPAVLPLEVLEQARSELFNYRNSGASVMELSYQAEEYLALQAEALADVRRVLDVPEGWQVLFCQGGGNMQFSAVPLNLMGLKPKGRGAYVNSGNFSSRALKEAGRYGPVDEVASSRDTLFDRIPEFDPAGLHPDTAYVHITSNNTVMGTQWPEIPRLEGFPLVVDATSELMSRPLDFSRIGLIYAGAQKNLGPPGLTVVIVREDLLGHARGDTPKLLDYTRLARENSMLCTPNTFAIYISGLVFKWILAQGGVEEMQQRALKRSGLVYEMLDRHSGFYRPHSRPEHRSCLNATFRLPTEGLEKSFLDEARQQGMSGLKGHKVLGGIRASMYNGLPVEWAAALAGFMDEFARRKG